MIAWQIRSAVTASVRRARIEGRKSIFPDRLTFLPTRSLAVLHGLGTTFVEVGINLGQAASSPHAGQQCTGSETYLLTFR